MNCKVHTEPFMGHFPGNILNRPLVTIFCSLQMRRVNRWPIQVKQTNYRNDLIFVWPLQIKTCFTLHVFDHFGPTFKPYRLNAHRLVQAWVQPAFEEWGYGLLFCMSLDEENKFHELFSNSPLR